MQENQQHASREAFEQYYDRANDPSHHQDWLQILRSIFHSIFHAIYQCPLVCLGYGIALLLTYLRIDFCEDDAMRYVHGNSIKTDIPPDDTPATYTLENVRSQLEEIYQLDLESSQSESVQ